MRQALEERILLKEKQNRSLGCDEAGPSQAVVSMLVHTKIEELNEEHEEEDMVARNRDRVLEGETRKILRLEERVRMLEHPVLNVGQGVSKPSHVSDTMATEVNANIH